MAAVDWLRADVSCKLPITLSVVVVQDRSAVLVVDDVVFLFFILSIIPRNKRVPLLFGWEGESVIGRVLNNITMIVIWHNEFVSVSP